MTDKRETFDYDGLPAYIALLEDWTQGELNDAYDRAVLPDGEWRLAMGVLVFGRYVGRFLRYCVPSLLAPGNLPALNGCKIVIHTDAGAVPILRMGLRRLEGIADVEIRVVPDEIISKVGEHEANKYWLLSAAHNAEMQWAKYQSHAYHMLMPDHVYADGYFAGVKRLAETHDAIVQTNISASMERVGPALDASGGVIEPKALNALALDNLHQQVTPYVMNERDDYPANLFLFFVGQSVHIASPHMSIVYLSHSLLMKAPLRLFNTVDGQLPFFIPDDVEPYVPSPDDGMAYIEISDAEKPYNTADGCSLNEFCVRFWLFSYCHEAHARFFDLTTVLALPNGYEPPIAPMSETAVAAKLDEARTAVHQSLPKVLSLAPEDRRTDPLTRMAA